MERFCITIVRDGVRMMKYPHNAMGTYNTEEEAAEILEAIKEVNRLDDVRMVLGENPDEAAVMPVECYESGDPKRVIFDVAS